MNSKFRFRLGIMVLAVFSAFTFSPNTSAKSIKADLFFPNYSSMFQANSFKSSDKLLDKLNEKKTKTISNVEDIHKAAPKEEIKNEKVENSLDFASLEIKNSIPNKKPVFKEEEVKPIYPTKPTEEYLENTKPVINYVKPVLKTEVKEEIKELPIMDKIQYGGIKPMHEIITKEETVTPIIKDDFIKEVKVIKTVKPTKKTRKFDFNLLTRKIADIFKPAPKKNIKNTKEDVKISRDFKVKQKEELTIPKYMQFINFLRAKKSSKDFFTRKEVKPSVSVAEMNNNPSQVAGFHAVDVGNHQDSVNAPSALFQITNSQINIRPDQSITLHEGWNLVSSYINPNNTSVESVFSELIAENSLEQVNNQTQSFDPNVPEFLNTLNTFEGGEGYWVKVNQDATLNLFGEDIRLPYNYSLNAHIWDLIGYPVDRPAKISCVLKSLIESGELQEVKDGNQNIIYSINNPTNENLYPGKGYWLRTTSPRELQISENCVLNEQNDVIFNTKGHDTTIEAGQEDEEIGRFKLENNIEDDVHFRKMYFDNIGSGDLGYLRNFGLYMNGEEISTEVYMQRGGVMVYLNRDSVIPRGESREFSVIADISRETRPESTFQFRFGAIELTNMNTQEEFNPVDTAGNPLNGDNSTLKKYTIGDIISNSAVTFTRTDGFNNNEVMVAGVTDATFMKFVMDNNDSGDVVVNSISAKLIGTGAAASNYSNFTGALFVDGQQIGSTHTFDSTSGAANFNDIEITIPSAGQEEVTVVVDTIEDVAGNSRAVINTNSNAISGNNTITANGGTQIYLSAGSHIVISTDGTTTGPGAEILTVADNTIIGSNSIIVDEVVTNSHIGEIISLLNQQNSTAKAAITAANITNMAVGSQVNAYEDNILLGDNNTDTTGDGNCNGGTADNYLCGATFTFIQSGTLNVVETGELYSDIIVAGETNVPVWKIRFSTINDEVHIKDLYLKNQFGSQFDDSANFKLYNEAGQLLAIEQMIGGKIHFELNSNQIIVPENSNTYVTVKVDVRDINDVQQTAKRLQLMLDTDPPHTSGMEALTGSTGSDLEQSAISGEATGVEFVAYKTKFTLDRIPTANTTLVNGVHQEIFRFRVTPDMAGDFFLGRVPLNIVKNGNLNINSLIAEDAQDANKVYPIDSNGQSHVVMFNDLLINSAKEYIVYADISSANQEWEHISTQLKQDTAYMGTYNEPNDFTINTTPIGTDKGIMWSDYSNPAGNDDYLGGYLLHPDTTSTGLSAN